MLTKRHRHRSAVLPLVLYVVCSRSTSPSNPSSFSPPTHPRVLDSVSLNLTDPHSQRVESVSLSLFPTRVLVV
ncbi:hypothetical protein BD626DRAFT_492699 [Schizophyllum amplum]|uniref:Secreted protein n=1 Tax=Schizophyllum amplum TaxID=97359 RepID=A0A550CG57_9AGAR|nr:hypothetical protein BD626DRAFT_492699 [Auriculariopsis ampla]